jgi:hypothetical protein
MFRFRAGACFNTSSFVINYIAFAGTLASAVAIASSNWVPKTARPDWTWCEDYAFAYSTYVVACEPERECQVGMGIFVFGEPRGEKISFFGQREITVIGIGSLHMRSTDGKGSVKVAFIQRTVALIKTPPIQW